MSKFIILDLDEITAIDERMQYVRDKLHAVDRELWLLRKALYDIEHDCKRADSDDELECVLDELDDIDDAISDMALHVADLIDITISHENQLIRRK